MKRLLPLVAALALVGCAPILHEAPPAPVAGLYAAYTASVGADLASTLHFRATCGECYESNLLMHPVVKAGPAPLIVASAAVAGGTIWLSEYLRRQPVTERAWWVVPLLSTVGHFLAALQNPR